MGAFEWISALVEWFAKFMPHYVVVRSNMGGVRFKGGKNPVPLVSGVHWYWPWRTEIELFPVKRQADDLRSQTVVTTDDKVVIVSGMVIYAVHDPILFGADTYDGPTTVIEISLTAIHDVVCQMSWDELKTEQRKGTLDTKLKNAAARMLVEYGVTVMKVMLTDLAPGRVLKLIQSTSKDGE